jgi:2-keto-3-deoxy-L-rhamnonate aldolase RhmA
LRKVEGIDVFFIGPNDLSHSMGYAAQMHHPEVKAMVKKASASIRGARKTCGTLVIGQTVAEFVAAGRFSTSTRTVSLSAMRPTLGVGCRKHRQGISRDDPSSQLPSSSEPIV